MLCTIMERIEIVSLFLKNNYSARTAAGLYNERYPHKHLSDNYVVDLIAKFNETDAVQSKRNIENPIRNESTEVAVLNHIAMDSIVNIKKLSDISELNDNDNDGRVKYYDILSWRIDNG
ncbi:hypothetical protein ABEB36_014227 [Hypothenemus hampei]|uniref:DUF4817 domain-containing protein n=1 Tax=Hypothenemus hampei TaxID=57062 RepID=A0ABD1E6H0_HYPHA